MRTKKGTFTDIIKAGNFPVYLANSTETCRYGHVTLRSEGLRSKPCPVCKKRQADVQVSARPSKPKGRK